MSGVRAATVLTLWGAAHQASVVSADAVLDQLSSTGRSAGVRAANAATADRTGLPGPGEASTGTLSLLTLMRTGGRAGLVLPVAGDVRGLPPRSPALVPALDAGAAVVLAGARVAVVPCEGHWRGFDTSGEDGPTDIAILPSLFDVEQDLDAAIRSATAQLARLAMARNNGGVRDKIADAMRAAAVPVPPGQSKTHRHGAALLAKVISLEALLQVAAGHDTAAISRYELAAMDDALRPLAAAVRAGRLAAVAELIDAITTSCMPGSEAAGLRWATAERDHGDGPS